QVPRELVHAIIQQESNWNDRAVSIKGACGLMQLMPRTASRRGVPDTFDMKQNISGGVRYLQYLLSQYHGDMRLAVAAYYAGEQRVRGLQYSNQQVIRYVEQVRRRYLKELASHIVLPSSAIKPFPRGMVVPSGGIRLRSRVALGVREISRPLEFASSYTLIEHAPKEALLEEIFPQAVREIRALKQAW